MTIYTERDENFPDYYYRLEKKGRFRMCPECHVYYVETDMPQYHGTGNLDQIAYHRLSLKKSRLIHTLISPDEKITDLEKTVNKCFTELGDELTNCALGIFKGHNKDNADILLMLVVRRFISSDDTRLRDNIMNEMYYHPSYAKLVLREFENANLKEFKWFGRHVYERALAYCTKNERKESLEKTRYLDVMYEEALKQSKSGNKWNIQKTIDICNDILKIDAKNPKFKELRAHCDAKIIKLSVKADD